MKLIYIASPYTVGDVGFNVRVQMDAAHRILDMGHCPVAPLLSHFLHIHRSRPRLDWLAMDMALLGRCDILLRLGGASPGATAEVAFAGKNGIPVVLGWGQLVKMLDPESYGRA